MLLTEFRQLASARICLYHDAAELSQNEVFGLSLDKCGTWDKLAKKLLIINVLYEDTSGCISQEERDCLLSKL